MKILQVLVHIERDSFMDGKCYKVKTKIDEEAKLFLSKMIMSLSNEEFYNFVNEVVSLSEYDILTFIKKLRGAS